MILTTTLSPVRLSIVACLLAVVPYVPHELRHVAFDNAASRNVSSAENARALASSFETTDSESVGSTVVGDAGDSLLESEGTVVEPLAFWDERPEHPAVRTMRQIKTTGRFTDRAGRGGDLPVIDPLSVRVKGFCEGAVEVANFSSGSDPAVRGTLYTRQVSRTGRTRGRNQVGRTTVCVESVHGHSSPVMCPLVGHRSLSEFTGRTAQTAR